MIISFGEGLRKVEALHWRQIECNEGQSIIIDEKCATGLGQMRHIKIHDL